MNKPYLSVVIPAYNEVDNIKKGALKEVFDYLKTKTFTWEVLIVNDHSTDATLEVARKFVSNHKGFKVLDEPHRGKGGTVISGMLAAKGDIVLFTDMDQATPLSEIEKFIEQFNKGADGVIGSRSGREGAPLTRKLMAFGFAILRTLILRLPYKDTQCGFKAFRGQSSKKIFKRMKVYTENAETKGAAVNAGFDLEVLYIARKLKLKVVEVPVAWHHSETKRVNPIKDSLEGLKGLLQVRLNAILGRYKG